MSRAKYRWFIVGVVALFFGLIVLSCLQPTDQVVARKGVLDLRSGKGLNSASTALLGEWMFYPGQLLTGAEKETTDSNMHFIQVPGNWRKAVDPIFHKNALGYGTYRLQILLEDGENEIGFRVPLIRASHRLFIDGREIGSQGIVSSEVKGYKSGVKPYITHTEFKGGILDLYVQVANYDFSFSGGIILPFQMGTLDSLYKGEQRDAALEFGIVVIFGFLSFFFGFMHFQAPRNGWIYISLFFLSLIFPIVFQGTRWIFTIWPGISFRMILILYWLSIFSITFWMFMFVYSQESMRTSQWVKRGIIIFNVLFIGLMLGLPLAVLTRLIPVLILETIAVFAYVLFILLRGMKNEDRYSMYKFLSFFLFAAHCFSNMLVQIGVNHIGVWYFLQILLFTSFFILMFMHQFLLAYRKLKTLTSGIKRVERLKNEFTASVSEQMMIPLNAVISIADARLHSDERLTPEQRADLQLVTSVGWTMRRLVDDLLDFSRLQEQEIRLHLRPVDLYAVMDEVMERTRYMIYNDSITMNNRIEKTMSPMIADEQRLYQILTGFLQQGIKLIMEGSITVDGTSREEFTEMRIHLHGKGITSVEQSLVREIWSQAADANFMQSNDGLGLFLIKRLVDLHKGTSRIVTEFDQEITFIVTFPLVGRNEVDMLITGLSTLQSKDEAVMMDSPWDVHKKDRDSEMDFSEGSIFVIDDDVLNLRLVRAILAQDQHRITVIRDPEQLRARFHELSKADLVIVNRTLPGTSGSMICRAIREQYTLFELPILLLTSPGHADQAIEAGLAGANDFLKKPLEASELRVRVRTLVQMKRLVTERIRMELGFLQAQIKPHFLFNTLNSIAALSKRRPEQMNQLLAELGHYLRESFRFDSSQPLTPFERELKLVQSYLHIEKVRFEDWLKFEIELFTSTQFRIPPLTIQPLVENAVRHGIMRRSEGGTLWIVVSRDIEYIWISIKDDGIGMTPETVASLLDTASREGGIGIRNIDRRLKQLFGYGLLIHSELDKGTEIQIRLPVEKVGIHESHIDR
ncbi:histidine kinase [Paenibacillus agri]|uniref:histidine kinase n=1 Tax=Paenibacillus agri TaxID=2744309 RepID=A0A850EUZ1_9BACL|nr:histidine kinase [Paenibacillus agri]NUU63499.1 histidine kinase [Paenibacillus agri]